MAIAYLKEWFGAWRAYVAEFLGTFVFVFVACGVALVNLFYADIGVLGTSLAAGVVYATMIFATIHLSGGHLNPAVTLAMWLAQKIRGTLAFFYIAVQLSASIGAAVLLLLIFGKRANEFFLGGPVIGAGISLQLAAAVEAILTAALVFAFFSTIVNRRGLSGFGPLVVGGVYMASAVFATNISGAALNPAKALGPAVISQSFDALAVWIIGPLAGSLFGLVYDFLFLRKNSKK